MPKRRPSDPNGLAASAERLVLLVEDNPDDALLARRAVTRCEPDFTVKLEVVSTGAAALRYLGLAPDETAALLPSLVLLDMKLADMDACEIIRQVRRRPQTRFLPVAMLSTSREPSDIARALEAGANSYICKPVDFESFVHLMAQTLRYWTLLNERVVP